MVCFQVLRYGHGCLHVVNLLVDVSVSLCGFQTANASLDLQEFQVTANSSPALMPSAMPDMTLHMGGK